MSRVQCKTCPWRVGASTSDIPGYSREKHEALRRTTIAIPGALVPTHTMACHHSTDDAPVACVGWLHNQLGPGNNIPLRMRAARDPSIADYDLRGPQRETMDDTFWDRGVGK